MGTESNSLSILSVIFINYVNNIEVNEEVRNVVDMISIDFQTHNF